MLTKYIVITLFLGTCLMALCQDTELAKTQIISKADLDAIIERLVSKDDRKKVDISITNLPLVNMISTVNIKRKAGVQELINVDLAPLFEKKSNLLLIGAIDLEGVKILAKKEGDVAERKIMPISLIQISESEVTAWNCFKDCEIHELVIISSKVPAVSIDDKIKLKKFNFIGEVNEEIKSSFTKIQTKE